MENQIENERVRNEIENKDGDGKEEKGEGGGKYAYVTMMMRGDSYLPGALVLGYSLRKVGTKYPLICMITTDVSGKAREALGLVYDRLMIVPYLSRECHQLRTPNIQEIYGGWINDSFTKLNIHSLDESLYDKAMFLDADKVVLSNLDHLFELPTPAGTFSCSHAKAINDIQNQNQNLNLKFTSTTHTKVNSIQTKSSITNPYTDIQHGQQVPDEKIIQGLNSAFVVIATCFIISPSQQKYDELKSYLKLKVSYEQSTLPPAHMSLPITSEQKMERLLLKQKRQKQKQKENYNSYYSNSWRKSQLSSSPSSRLKEKEQEQSNRNENSSNNNNQIIQPYGWKNCYSGCDEQALTEFYLFKTHKEKWTHIHQQYNAIPWHVNWLDGHSPKLFHYVSRKPWAMDRDKYLDTEAFWILAQILCKEYPTLTKFFPEKQMNQNILGCGWCKDQLGLKEEIWKFHNILNSKGILDCPQLKNN
jgi:alpha-N-acetylglucosamine transferase